MQFRSILLKILSKAEPNLSLVKLPGNCFDASVKTFSRDVVKAVYFINENREPGCVHGLLGWSDNALRTSCISLVTRDKTFDALSECTKKGKAGFAIYVLLR